MRSSVKAIIAVLIAVAVILFPLVTTYNSLVSQRENVTSVWAQVENQLQRRYDLIPNLVATVKGYAAHEEAVLEALADARARLGGAASIEAKSEANDEMTQALGRLLVVVENYPNLKADQEFMKLQDELAGTENRIAVARKDYNEAARSFNARISSLPTSLIARIFGFTKFEYFASNAGAATAPEVGFTPKN